MTLAPARPRWLLPSLEAGVGHLLLGLLLGGSGLCMARALAGGRIQRTAVALAVGATTAFLMGTELLQGLTTTRRPEVVDAVADLAGVVLAVGLLVPAFSLVPRRSDRVADAFVSLAIVSALGVTIGGLASPSERPSASWPVTGPSDCIETYKTLPGAVDNVEPSEVEPAPAVLAQFDLTSDPTRSVGSLSPIELVVSGGAVARSEAGADFSGSSAALDSVTPPVELIQAVASRESFSADAFFSPSDTSQTGPTRIVTLSSGSGRSEVDFHLGLEGDRLSVRLRTRCGPLWFLVGAVGPEGTHAAVTFDRGRLTMYLAGRPVASAVLRDASLSRWDRRSRLLIGNEATLNRGFRGTVRSVGFYAGVLTGEEIAQRAVATDPDLRREVGDGGGS